MTQLKFIFRKLWRDRFFTFLKVLGLAIGIATCLVVFKIVYYEFSFDRNHPDKEDIYQVVVRFNREGEESGFGGIQSAVAEYVKENFAEIEQIVPVNDQFFPNVAITQPDGELFQKEDPKQIKSTVSEYFDMVPYPWLAGNKTTALSQPNQAVLTQSRAVEYFGEVSPSEIIGKTMDYGGKTYTISGIVADLNFPSSFDGKEFLAIPKTEGEPNWFSFNSSNKLFVKLDGNQKERLLTLLDKKYNEMIPDAWKDEDSSTNYSLLPLSEKHFAEDFSAGDYVANKKILYGLIGIGIFILLLASINYINLSTAQIPYRTKEIGVRKTLGEKGGRITKGFLLETLSIAVLAVLVAIPLSKGFEIFYEDFLPPNIGDYSAAFSISIFIVCLVAILTVLTGMYPAYLINRVNVSEVLKIQGAGKLSFGNLTIRKAMIVFQFVIAQVFVIGAFIIFSQIKYMINTDLGFKKDAVVNIKLPYKPYQNANVNPFVFKEALKKHPEIRQVALGHTPMNNMHWGNNLNRTTDSGEKELNMNFKYVDNDYVDLFGIEILAGRAPQLRDSVGSVFINEAARAGLDFTSNEEAIGETVQVSGKNVVIQGVFNDFHQRNLHASKTPLSLMISADKETLMEYSIKLPENPADWNKALIVLEGEWKTFYPNAPFEYKFYDAEIAKLYESDMRQSQIINLATIITIILGCLGLIGLVTLTAYQRTKEIGIRKVLGSSVSDVVVLLSKDYLKLIGIAILISIPIAWWAMHKWLENFAYRIEIKWWMFLVTGVITILIALTAVSFRAIKAALANPVDSLKDE